MPEAPGTAPPWVLALAFIGGGGCTSPSRRGSRTWQRRKEASVGAGAWMVYVAVASDLVGDGLLIGAGACPASSACSWHWDRVLADLPAPSNFRDKGVGRRRRLLVSASFAAPVVASAALAFFFLRDQAEAAKKTRLVFVAGLYILAAVEDMLEEPHESAEDSRWSALGFLFGVALFLLVLAGMG